MRKSESIKNAAGTAAAAAILALSAVSAVSAGTPSVPTAALTPSVLSGETKVPSVAAAAAPGKTAKLALKVRSSGILFVPTAIWSKGLFSDARPDLVKIGLYSDPACKKPVSAVTGKGVAVRKGTYWVLAKNGSKRPVTVRIGGTVADSSSDRIDSGKTYAFATKPDGKSALFRFRAPKDGVLSVRVSCAEKASARILNSSKKTLASGAASVDPYLDGTVLQGEPDVAARFAAAAERKAAPVKAMVKKGINYVSVAGRKNAVFLVTAAFS